MNIHKIVQYLKHLKSFQKKVHNSKVKWANDNNSQITENQVQLVSIIKKMLNLLRNQGKETEATMNYTLLHLLDWQRVQK